MEFPHRDADLIALARKIIAGMTENPDFPAPPFSTSDLRNLMEGFMASDDAQAAAQSAAQQSTDTKRAARRAFADGIRAMVDYAVNAVHGDDAKLAAIGWGPRATPTPHIIELPGQPLNVRATEQGEGAVTFTWEESSDGDEAVCYRVECRVLNGETISRWQIVGAPVHTYITLTEQERSKTLEYRVIAVNKAGDSLPSNTVTVVL